MGSFEPTPQSNATYRSSHSLIIGFCLKIFGNLLKNLKCLNDNMKFECKDDLHIDFCSVFSVDDDDESEY